MKDLKKDKIPESDGLTMEFYDFFWDILSHFYMDCVKEIYEKKLTESQKKDWYEFLTKKS